MISISHTLSGLFSLKRRKKSRQRSFGIQPLEARILPATMVSPTELTYQDVDGDNVTVTFSNKFLTPTNVNTIFKFNTGTVNGSNALKQQLRRINLASFASADGTDITTVSTRSIVGGDGFAAVGEINARQRDLGIVTIDGDLGRVLAGNAATDSFGISQLIVQSMGRFGKTTGAVDLHSQIVGPLDVLNVKTDIKAAFVEVIGGVDGVDGRMSIITVGGSLIGGTLKDSGRIHSTGTMGKVRVGGDLHGGAGVQTGIISSFSNIAEVSVGGSIIGGSNSYAGGIITDFKGGGPTQGEVGANIGAVTIKGDVIGGTRVGAGSVISESGSIGPVTVGGSLLGGVGDRSAQIYCAVDLGAVWIGGDVVGGKGVASAEIESQTLGISSVVIGGTMQGGKGNTSGSIRARLTIGSLQIGRDLVGGDGSFSGYVLKDSIVGIVGIGTVKIGGSIRGGNGVTSGGISSRSEIGAVTIGGSIVGGTERFSGFIDVTFGGIASVSVGGSLIGGSADLTGFIAAERNIGPVFVKGNIQGGSQAGDLSLTYSGSIVCGAAIQRVTVGGSLIAGTDNTTGVYKNNGAIIANEDIGTVIISGSMIGNDTAAVLISARGKSQPPAGSDIAIGSISVAGRVERALIIAGRDSYGLGQNNADAQITRVTVGGDWIASSLVAGADTGADGRFGTQDDVKMSGPGVKNLPNVFSRISNLTIGGQVIGSDNTADHFSIVAENIGVLTINGAVVPIFPGAHNDNRLLSADIDGFFGNVRLREL